jgi:hypothetical protein
MEAKKKDFEKRLTIEMKRAFYDQVEERMRENPTEANEWIVSLHGELANRFKAVLPSKATEIDDYMDNTLFKQQLYGGTFGSDEMVALIEYSFKLLKIACAPDQDKDIAISYAKIKDIFIPGVQFSKLVPHFLMEMHIHQDEIIRRIVELKGK